MSVTVVPIKMVAMILLNLCGELFVVSMVEAAVYICIYDVGVLHMLTMILTIH